jgi:hypothetical protein
MNFEPAGPLRTSTNLGDPAGTTPAGQEGGGGGFDTIAESGGSSAEEHIRLVSAVDGAYRLVVNGFTVPPGASYLLEIRQAQGDDLTVSNVPTGTVPANTTVRLTLTYSLDYTKGSQQGVLFFGPRGAPMVIEVPVAITRGEPRLFLPLTLQRR